MAVYSLLRSAAIASSFRQRVGAYHFGAGRLFLTAPCVNLLYYLQSREQAHTTHAPNNECVWPSRLTRVICILGMLPVYIYLDSITCPMTPPRAPMKKPGLVRFCYEYPLSMIAVNGPERTPLPLEPPCVENVQAGLL